MCSVNVDRQLHFADTFNIELRVSLDGKTCRETAAGAESRQLLCEYLGGRGRLSRDLGSGFREMNVPSTAVSLLYLLEMALSRTPCQTCSPPAQRRAVVR